MAKIIDENNFDELVLNSDKAVMVDFYASWCAPCKMIAPYIDELSKELDGSAEVFKADIDKNESLCERFSINAVPTLLFFKNGKFIDRSVGVVPKSSIEDKIKAII